MCHWSLIGSCSSNMAADWFWRHIYKKHCFHVIKEMWRECCVLLLNQLVPSETGLVVKLTVTWLCLSRPSKPLIRPEVFSRAWLWHFYVLWEYDDDDWMISIRKIPKNMEKQRNKTGPFIHLVAFNHVQSFHIILSRSLQLACRRIFIVYCKY